MSARFDTNRRQLLTGLTGLAAGALLAPGRLDAGSLEPPGPPGPTMLPLSDIEPRTIVNEVNTPGNEEAMFVISQPGSYYLVDSIPVPSGMIGILVNSDNVCLDLMGHKVGSSSSAHCVICCGDGGRSRIIVRNGSLLGPENNFSIDLGRYGGHTSRVEQVYIKKHTARGLRVGPHSVVLSCNVVGATEDALVAGDDCLIRRCRISHGNWNTSIGPFRVRIGRSSLVTQCLVFPPHMIECGEGCIVTSCDCAVSAETGSLVTLSGTAHSNADGISVSEESLVGHCTANQPGQTTLCVAGGQNVVADNQMIGAPAHVLGTGNLIVRNTLAHGVQSPPVFADGNSWRLVVGSSNGGFSGDAGGGPLDIDDLNSNLLQLL